MFWISADEEMTAPEAYTRLRISDVSVGDDVVIGHFVSYVCFGV
jgi:hypothetical protein